MTIEDMDHLFRVITTIEATLMTSVLATKSVAWQAYTGRQILREPDYRQW